MKKLFLSAVLLFAMASTAIAGNLGQVFTATDGSASFDVQNARYFDQNPNGWVNVVFTGGGSGLNFTDTGGALYAALTNSPAITASFVKMYGVPRWINVGLIRKMVCSGSVLTVMWVEPNATTQAFNDPGCTAYSYIVAQGN